MSAPSPPFLHHSQERMLSFLPPGFMEGNRSEFSMDLILKRHGNIQPWLVFDKAWTPVMGYPAENFNFVPGETPLSTFKETAVALSLYYFVIFAGRRLMRDRPAFRLNGLFLFHNLVLTIVSGILLALFVEQLLPMILTHGLFYSICDAGAWRKRLITLYYLNYLVKYVELLDTVFLFLKKKPLTLLHCYHHGATALLCYTQLVGYTSISWVPITLNLTVHVVMYWYYFQSARGVRLWWKEWITRLQIAQFVLDLGFIFYGTYSLFATIYFTILPTQGSCAGTKWAAFFGCAILSSYLFLFISFYIATYKKVDGGHKNTRSKATSLIKTKEITCVEEASGRVIGALEGCRERSWASQRK